MEDNHLWRVAGGHRNMGRAKVECITRDEAIALAQKEHEEKGPWGRDTIKKALMDRIWCPRLDSSIVTGIS
jgi:hypothetical protein